MEWAFPENIDFECIAFYSSNIYGDVTFECTIHYDDGIAITYPIDVIRGTVIGNNLNTYYFSRLDPTKVVLAHPRVSSGDGNGIFSTSKIKTKK